MARAFPSVVIDNVQPLIDCGRSPIKRIVGEDLVVEADIFKDGHDVVAAVLKWRVVGKRAWRETPMIFVDNDRWRGVCTLYDQAIHEYTVEAWTDTFRSWQQEFAKKFEGGISDLRSEALEGAAIVKGAASRARDRADSARLREFAEQIVTGANSEIYAIAQSGELEVLMATYPDRADATQYEPIPHVVVDRPVALFGAWYEFFPRSAEGHGDRGSTFRDCLPRVDDAKAMGFDVLYFPPIHPIGGTSRKGRNNAVTCEPGDPGVPWAIGGEAGGHKAVEPSLGTLEDFDWLQRKCANAEWKSPSISRLIARLIIRTSRNIPSGSTNGRTARSNSRRTRQKIRRHLSDKLSMRKLARALGRDEEHRAVLGRARCADLSRGQSAYEAGRLLGVFDRRRSRKISRRDFSRRSVHQAKDDESAGQSRV